MNTSLAQGHGPMAAAGKQDESIVDDHDQHRASDDGMAHAPDEAE